MITSNASLNALRAFEAAARHLSFTQAGLELRVTQAAISHQIKGLEEILGVQLFRRLPRGLALTDEGQALVPVLSDSFGRIQAMLNRFENGQFHDVVTVGVVGTFATGWLLGRLDDFRRRHPHVDLRILTNNNRIDLAGEGLDYAIRFGNGSWHSLDARPLMAAPLSAVSAPQIAARLATPADIGRETLLRSYRADEWRHWFAAAGVASPIIRGVVFDSSVTMAEAAAHAAGVALVPVRMFRRDLALGRLVRPFDVEIDLGRYWLTSLKSRVPSRAMRDFADWLLQAIDADEPG
jgi:LysR family transcriptional regulator, regulator of gene expression of beta-lactamase